MSHNLTAGSLKLPFAEGVVPPITSLFDDPRRGNDGWVPGLARHEGIDWGCGMNTTIYPMSSGTVMRVRDLKSEPDPDYGYLVTVRTGSVGHGFTLTYAHLSTVAVAKGDEVIPYDPSLKENTEPDQKKNTPLGTSGNTGNSTGAHLHVHFIPDSATTPLLGFIGHYRNFQQYLPAGHYHWPDIKALQATIDALQKKIDAGIADSAEREVLIRKIDHWMDNVLQGEVDPDKARLMVTPGRPVYMLPRVDEEFAYPCRLFPGSTIVGKDNAVWDLPHPFAETLPTPDWWKIEINRSFPVCWVPAKHAREIGNLHPVPLVSPSRPTNLPRYLQKNDGVNVRSTEHTRKDENGELVPDASNIILLRQGKNGSDPFWGPEDEDSKPVLDSENPIRPRLAGWVPITRLMWN